MYTMECSPQMIDIKEKIRVTNDDVVMSGPRQTQGVMSESFSPFVACSCGVVTVTRSDPGVPSAST